ASLRSEKPAGPLAGRGGLVAARLLRRQELPRELASLPGSEPSNDLFTQRRRKRLLARDHAGLPDRLADLVDVGGAAGAVGEVSLEPLPLVGRQRLLEVVGDDLDHLLALELVVHVDSAVR